MRYRLALALLALGVFLSPVSAEHANIELRFTHGAKEGHAKVEEYDKADTDPPQGGIYPRPLFQAKANEPLVLQFFLTNKYPHGEKKNVIVRYFVVREEKPRQKTVPDLKKGTVTEGRFTLNFKPERRVGARVAFTIKEPGTYLLRVQTENTDSDHEHFSAVDLQVK
ncbi:MAG TPA: hypothetical protein VG013_38495 [Gemmataceae bacterium]|jgi:hypothetical protein|nr:hypothetical protein [Gemmataceae bacterium]